jgi:uncharacterized protein
MMKKLQYKSILPERLGDICNHPIILRILESLGQNLPPQYCYHSVEHSIEVLRDSVSYAFLDGVSEKEIQLIAIAAAYHDSGFLLSAHNHEEESVRLVMEALSLEQEWSPTDQATICQIILDTKVVQPTEKYWKPPKHPLSRYVLDADVSNLGQSNFLDKTELICREIGAERENFLRQALSFIERHRWYTLPAKQLLQSVKEQNIQALRNLLGVNRPILKGSDSLLKVVTEELRFPVRFIAGTLSILDSLKSIFNGQQVALHLFTGSGAAVSISVIGHQRLANMPVVRSELASSQIIRPISCIYSLDGEFAGCEVITAPLAPFSMDCSGILEIIGNASENYEESHLLVLENIAERICLTLTAFFQGIEGEHRRGLTDNKTITVKENKILSSWGKNLLRAPLVKNNFCSIAAVAMLESIILTNMFTLKNSQASQEPNSGLIVSLQCENSTDEPKPGRKSYMGLEGNNVVPLFNQDDWELFLLGSYLKITQCNRQIEINCCLP